MAKKDQLPQWIIDGIKDAKFQKSVKSVSNGRILEIYEKEKKADVQMDKAMDDGRHIVTMDLSKKIKLDKLERGIVYKITFASFKAPLSKKIIDFLKEQEVDMDAIYKFELESLVAVDEN